MSIARRTLKAGTTVYAVREYVDICDIDRSRVQRIVDGCATEDVARKCIGVPKTILNEAKGDGVLPWNPAEARFSMPPKGRFLISGILTGNQTMNEILSDPPSMLTTTSSPFI